MAYQLEGFLTFYVPHQCQKHLLQISAWALFPPDTCCSIIKIKRLNNKNGWQRTKRRRKSIPEDLSSGHSQQEQACWVDLANVNWQLRCSFFGYVGTTLPAVICTN